MRFRVDWTNDLQREDLTASAAELLPLPQFGQYTLNAYSMVNFASITEPLVRTVSPQSMCEIGLDRGENTEFLLWLAAEVGAELTLVDPSIGEDLRKRILAGAEATTHVVSERSIAYLEQHAPHDVYFVDGDHNYETVSAELRLIDEATAGRDVLVVLHDVGWPFAYRDMYYAPEAVDEPKAYAFGRLSPFDDKVGDYGLPFDMALAEEEGGPANGVLKAVEDLVEASGRNWGLARFNLLFGLGILYDRDTASPQVAALMAFYERVATDFHQLFSSLELNRLMLLTRLYDTADIWRRQQERIAELEQQIALLTAPAELRAKWVSELAGTIEAAEDQRADH